MRTTGARSQEPPGFGTADDQARGLELLGSATRADVTLEPTVPDLLLILADVVAVTVLAYACYFRRHRRRDMLLAYLALNVGVLAVSTVLIDSGIGIGLGLGLFGVLSIIRLRSSEISHEEVAYYFAALALGLIFGMSPEPRWLAPLLATLVICVMAVVDRAPDRARARRQMVTLDRVYADREEMTGRLEEVVGGTVTCAVVQQTDLVRDSMLVDVRYRVTPLPPVVAVSAARTQVTSGALQTTAGLDR